MESLLTQLAVLVLIVVAFGFLLGGRRGGRAVLGCLLAPLRGCASSAAAGAVGVLLLLALGALALHALRGDSTPDSSPTQNSVDRPHLPSPDDKPPQPEVVRFDYPVGTVDAKGRCSGDGWYVSQDPADTLHPLSAERSGQHLGEDWLKRGGSFAGEPVRAIADGKVIRSCADKSYGHLVMIKHPLPEGSDPPYVISLYGHLGTEGVVAPEATVERGKVIGSIGAKGDNGVAKSTGKPWPEHLHFELRQPTHEREDDWIGYGYSTDHTGFLNPTNATSPGNPPTGGWIDAHR